MEGYFQKKRTNLKQRKKGRNIKKLKKEDKQKIEGRYNEKMKKMFFFVLNKYQSFYLHFSRRKEFEEKKEKGVVNT